MTEKHKKFVVGYLECGDKVEAYLNVYSNCKNRDAVYAYANKILSREDVKRYIESLDDGSVESENEIAGVNYDSEVATEHEIHKNITAIARGDKPCDKDQFRAWEVLNRTIAANKNDEAVMVVFEGMDKLED